MRVLKGLLAASLVLGVASAAQAQTVPGWYVGAETGVNFDRDEKGVSGAKTTFDPGFALLGQGGYAFGNNIRLEAELGYRTNGVDKAASATASGDVDAYSLMANAYYDIPTGTAFVPYVGAGLGGAYLDTKVKQSGATLYSGNDTVLAYQGIAGVAYNISDNLAIKGDYRYFGTMDPSYRQPDHTSVKSEFGAHTLMVGFSYKFGAPAPKPVAAAPVAAPAPAPAPAPVAPVQAVVPHNYMVFFDFDKADVTTTASAIIQQAAANYKTAGAARVELTGHTDTTGSDKYNVALSLKRANAVKAALVKQGVPADSISVVAKGKSAPLVATGDGVREPQNRRVEIVMP